MKNQKAESWRTTKDPFSLPFTETWLTPNIPKEEIGGYIAAKKTY